MKIISLVVASLLALAATAQAQALNYPVFDWHRVNFGVSVGAHALDETRAATLADEHGPRRFGLNFAGQFAYSASPEIAFGGSADWDPAFDFGRAVFPAVNFAIASDKSGGHGVQLFMRAGWAHYYGDNADALLAHEVDGEIVAGKRDVLEVALPLSWRLHRSRNKKHAWFLGIDPRVDITNSMPSIVGRLQYGLTPVPPQ